MTPRPAVRTVLPLAALALTAAGLPAAARAQFNPGPNPITGTTTTAQTLAGGTGTVSATGNLLVGGASVAVTVTGSSSLVNNGTIQQTGTGRGLRNNVTGLSLTVTNNAGALIQTADADAFQMAQAGSSVTMNNYGSVISLNASAGGAQAIDWNAVTAANVLNNYAGGLLKAFEADAVRPGVNGTVFNAGTILAVTTTGSSSDGIDAQTNSGVQVTNAGLVEGGRHGLTGGNTAGTGAYAMTIVNQASATIRGDNGSGVNIDGLNANEVVTLTNAGTITGNGRALNAGETSHDGDGVDVDGLVNLTNSGTIRSLNAIANTSEGVTVGGGTITNQAGGLIEGDVAAGNTSGAVGRGITLAGIDTGGVQTPIYANSVINNAGTIRGQTDSGIAVGGGASGFTVTINNLAGGLIEGGGATAAAIQTSADDDTVNNSGRIVATGGGLAVDLGAGNNTLNVLGGNASIVGNVSGGVGGTNALTLSPGAGNTFTYAGRFSNFASVQVNAGTVILSGDSTYAGPTTVANGGTLVAVNAPATGGSATGTGAVTVQSGGTLAGTGRVGGNVTLDAGGRLSPGDPGSPTPGVLTLGGDLNVAGGARFVFTLGADAAGSDRLVVNGSLNFNGPGQLIFDVLDGGGLATGRYELVDFGAVAGLTLANLALGDTPAGFRGTFDLNGGSLGLTVDVVPEPATTWALLAGGLILGGAVALKRRRPSVH